jgi:Fe-S-cluster-containing dehydrogenase component
MVACKTENNVPIGNYWDKVVRIGPNPKEGGSGNFPDIEMYFLPLQCQHCSNAFCVEVCPTQASHYAEDGTVQIDKQKCIGCQFCVMACPYNVRYLNKEERVVEKCTLCEQKITAGELPQCVIECGGRARYFGDLDKGLDTFEGPAPMNVAVGKDYKKVNSISYDAQVANRATLKDAIEPYQDSDVYHLPDRGNHPSICYILRDRKWQGGN